MNDSFGSFIPFPLSSENDSPGKAYRPSPVSKTPSFSPESHAINIPSSSPGSPVLSIPSCPKSPSIASPSSHTPFGAGHSSIYSFCSQIPSPLSDIIVSPVCIIPSRSVPSASGPSQIGFNSPPISKIPSPSRSYGIVRYSQIPSKPQSDKYVLKFPL